jgi:hypothetical protein
LTKHNNIDALMTMSCFLINSIRAPIEFLIIKLIFHLNFHLCTFKMLQAHFTSYRWDSKEGGEPSSINRVNAWYGVHNFLYIYIYICFKKLHI